MKKVETYVVEITAAEIAQLEGDYQILALNTLSGAFVLKWTRAKARIAAMEKTGHYVFFLLEEPDEVAA